MTLATALGLACPGISLTAALALGIHAIRNRRKNP
jgi:hypothetical protein